MTGKLGDREPDIKIIYEVLNDIYSLQFFARKGGGVFKGYSIEIDITCHVVNGCSTSSFGGSGSRMQFLTIYHVPWPASPPT